MADSVLRRRRFKECTPFRWAVFLSTVISHSAGFSCQEALETILVEKGIMSDQGGRAAHPDR